MKLLPHDSSTKNTDAPSSHHFMRPGTTNMPSTNRKHTTAPMYTGPEVKGWSPQ